MTPYYRLKKVLKKIKKLKMEGHKQGHKRGTKGAQIFLKAIFAYLR
jgi:hypothetical protein